MTGDPDLGPEWIEQHRRLLAQRLAENQQQIELVRQRLRHQPGKRWLVYLGGVGTSIVALEAFAVAFLLFYGGFTGKQPAGVPAVGFFVAGLIPAVYGLAVAWAAYHQFRMDDDDLTAPKAAALALLCPGLLLGTAFQEHDPARIGPGFAVAAAIGVAVVLSLIGGLVLRRELTR